jgi:hypothetical protein
MRAAVTDLPEAVVAAAEVAAEVAAAAGTAVAGAATETEGHNSTP